MKYTLPMIGVALLCSSCASSSRLVTNALGAAGGAAIGNQLSDGNPLMTAAGAAGGLLAGEAIQQSQEKKTQASFTEGYDKGRSDAVKQQYWLMVDRQKADGNAGGDVSLFEFPLPDRMPDGTIFHPNASRTLRIEE